MPDTLDLYVFVSAQEAQPLCVRAYPGRLVAQGEATRHALRPLLAYIGSVVTGDWTHLLRKKEYQGIPIISARSFLDLLESEHGATAA